MKYATKECADCSVILPANEMKRATDRISSGTTERYTLVQGGYKQTGKTQSYRSKAIFLCPGCAEKRRVWRNRKLGLVAGVVAPFVPLVMISAFSEYQKGSAQGSSSEAAVQESVATSAVETVTYPPPSALADTASTPAVAATEDGPEPALATTEGRGGADDQAMLGYIENWIELALSDNRDTEWSMEGRKGVVEVTAAPSIGGRVCRSYRVIIFEDSASREIGAGSRCATMGNGGWVDF